MLQDCKILVTEISMSSNSDSAETSRNTCSRTLAGVMRCDAMTEVQPWTRAIRQRRNTRRSLPDSSLPLDLGPRFVLHMRVLRLASLTLPPELSRLSRAGVHFRWVVVSDCHHSQINTCRNHSNRNTGGNRQPAARHDLFFSYM
jgi:hypothetical protein